MAAVATRRDRMPSLRLRRGIPLPLLRELAPLVFVARNLGVGVSGTRGIGKSQLLRAIAWTDFVFHETPCVVLDPVGATIDGLLGHVAHFHPDDQAKLWARIRYVNLSPIDHVVPLPLYYRTGVGRETLFSVAQRLPDALGKLDPNLRAASVEGFNALWELATHAGRVLAALGFQPSELEPLLVDPAAWEGRFVEAVARSPEVIDSVAFFRERFLGLTPARRQERARSLLAKLALLADPPTKAQFCAGAPGLDWVALMERRQLWLFDLRNEHDWETRRFKLLFLWLAITDFARRWGAAHAGDRTRPLAVTIDEVSFMFSRAAGQRSPLVDDLDAIVNQYSRNVNLHLVVAWQELYQLPSGLKETLLSLGTQFFGRMTDPDSMREVADRLTVHDAQLGTSVLVDGRPHELGFAELREENRRALAVLPKYGYLVSRTVREGEPPRSLDFFSVASLAARRFPPPDLLARIRADLSRRDGRPMGELVAEIAARQARPDQTPKNASPAAGRMIAPPSGETTVPGDPTPPGEPSPSRPSPPTVAPRRHVRRVPVPAGPR